MTAILTLNNVSISYEDSINPVVKNINLSINRGECIALLGHSGSGKSTLLKAIAGYKKNCDGTILMDGIPINGASWERGVVFQDSSLYPWLSVKKNVAFGLKMRHFDNDFIKNKVNQILENVGLLENKNDKIFELSGGMRQRAALARVLVNEPKIAMLDEAFGALDVATKSEMHQLVLNLWKKTKTTFLFVTHDIDEAVILGQKIAILSDSKPSSVVSYRGNPYFGDMQNESVDRESYKKGILDTLK